jgi:hypothetical protein
MSIRSHSRKRFEQQGVLLTRLHLDMGNMTESEKEEIILWLAEKERDADRRESARYRWMLIFTIVAAVGATIAAVPIVKEWLSQLAGLWF